MIYTKSIKTGKETPLTAIPLFCKCPVCGMELEMNVYDVLEMAQTSDDSLDVFSIYCPDCNEELENTKESIRSMDGALDCMPLDTLREIHAVMLPFWCGGDAQA